MKNYKIFLSTVVGVGLMLASFASLADNDRQGVVTLVSLVGRAAYSLDGGHTWIPAVIGKELSPGALIRTEDKSMLSVLIGESMADKNIQMLQTMNRHAPAPNLPPQIEKNIIVLRPNSILGVDKLVVPDTDPTVVSDCELDLKKGKLYASVKKVSPSSEYLVKVPNGVAAVRGTEFLLSADGNGGDLCQVISGTVWLSITVLDSNGNPIMGPNGSPAAPVQFSIGAGEEINISPALLSSLAQAMSQPGGASPSTIDQIVNAATAPIPPQTLSTLASSGQPVLNNPIITVTGGNNLPTDVSAH
jgi:hypothetical protein